MELSYLLSALEKICPLKLSYDCIEQGGYDNSGLLVKTHQSVNKILFSLDFSAMVVQKAISVGADTVITHHPAIYQPIKTVGVTENDAIALAVKNDLNVISMHLNLDIVSDGIDDGLAYGLGGVTLTTLNLGFVGYGKEFLVEKTTLNSYAEKVAKTFGTQKLLVYGNPETVIEKVASFCGAGGSEGATYNGNANLIVTSDLAHHEIKQIIEKGKNLIILPHYVAENYGFTKFYNKVTKLIGNEVKTEIFVDERFI